MDTIQIDIERLVEAQWNANVVPPGRLEKIRRSIEQFGLVENLVARPHPDQPDRFEVLSGNHRLRLLNELGYEQVPVVVHSRNRLKQPKTPAGIRSVPIFASVQTALETLHARAITRGIAAPEQLLFQTEHGKPIHASNFNRRYWQPAVKHAGLTDQHSKPLYRFHDLRHSCISRLVAAGADIKLIQQIAGHANPLITLNRYSHLLEQRIAEAADRYDPL